MTFETALKIMFNGAGNSGQRYEAVQVISSAVCNVSEYGDPDNILEDWIDARQYKPTDTPESIANEWDKGLV